MELTFIEILTLMEVRLNEMSLICVKPARFENEGLLFLNGRAAELQTEMSQLELIIFIYCGVYY